LRLDDDNHPLAACSVSSEGLINNSTYSIFISILSHLGCFEGPSLFIMKLPLLFSFAHFKIIIFELPFVPTTSQSKLIHLFFYYIQLVEKTNS